MSNHLLGRNNRPGFARICWGDWTGKTKPCKATLDTGGSYTSASTGCILITSSHPFIHSNFSAKKHNELTSDPIIGLKKCSISGLKEIFAESNVIGGTNDIPIDLYYPGTVNTYLDLEDESLKGFFYYEGMKVESSCLDGYGSLNVNEYDRLRFTCNSDGEWEATDGICEANTVACKIGDLKKNNPTIEFDIKLPLEDGKEFTGKCKDGYTGSESITAKCESGTWTVSGGECTVSACDISKIAEDCELYASYGPSNNSSYNFPTSGTATGSIDGNCYDYTGYTGEITATCNITDGVAKWTCTKNCTKTYCSNNELNSNNTGYGKYIHNTELIKANNEITLNCDSNKGYSGTLIAECGSDLNWIVTNNCKITSCPNSKLDKINNGIEHFSKFEIANTGATEFGNEVKGICADCYVVKQGDEPKAKCTAVYDANGEISGAEWVYSGTCEPGCLKTELELNKDNYGVSLFTFDNNNTTNTSAVGETAVGICNTGYTGSVTATCTKNNDSTVSWSVTENCILE